MALPTSTLDAIIKRAQAFYRTSFPGKPMGTKKFFGRSARALGLNVWGFHKAVEDLDRDIVVSQNSSDDAITEWAVRIGLPNGDGANGVGRLVATAATGGAALLTGARATAYPDAAVATAEDGVTQIKLSGAVTISGTPPGSGSVSGKFIAVTKGTAGNLPAGTVCTWESSPSGADATFTLTTGLSGAVDVEDNAATYGRIVARLQTPPLGGMSADFRKWAQAGGASVAYVYPRRSGTGSVDVVIALSGAGQSRIPSGSIQTAVVNSIAESRPTAVDGVSVLLPSMPNGNGHYVRVRVLPSKAKYNFDWVDTAGYTVAGYSAGPPATLTLSATAPQSLQDAIATYAASLNIADAPRLQVISTLANPIGSAVNPPIRVVAIDGTKLILTLETVPTGWTAPTVSDKVFAYGPVVATISAGIQALADALGPSRVTGYGDPLSPWSDTLSLFQIVRVAEEAVDSDGSVLISEALPNGVTIDSLTLDVTGVDRSSLAPELLYLKGIAVTQ